MASTGNRTVSSIVRWIFPVAILGGFVSSLYHASGPIEWILLRDNLQFTSHEVIRNTLNETESLENFFLTRPSQLQKQLMGLPWVASASVRKVWPNSIQIRLKEYDPIAIWNESWLLDKRGFLFHKPSTPPLKQKLLCLHGPEETARLLIEIAEQLNLKLKPHELVLTTMTLSEQGCWTIELNDHITLILGDISQLFERIERFYLVWPQLNQAAFIDKKLSLDWRYKSGFALGIQNILP